MFRAKNQVFFQVGCRIAAPVDGEENSDAHCVAAVDALVVTSQPSDSASGSGDVTVFCLRAFDSRDTPDVGDEIAIALVTAGRGEIVFRKRCEQGHQRIHEGGLTAPRGPDDGSALGMDEASVPPLEGPPVHHFQFGEAKGNPVPGRCRCRCRGIKLKSQKITFRFFTHRYSRIEFPLRSPFLESDSREWSAFPDWRAE